MRQLQALLRHEDPPSGQRLVYVYTRWKSLPMLAAFKPPSASFLPVAHAQSLVFLMTLSDCYQIHHRFLRIGSSKEAHLQACKHSSRQADNRVEYASPQPWLLSSTLHAPSHITCAGIAMRSSFQSFPPIRPSTMEQQVLMVSSLLSERSFDTHHLWHCVPFSPTG